MFFCRKTQTGGCNSVKSCITNSLTNETYLYKFQNLEVPDTSAILKAHIKATYCRLGIMWQLVPSLISNLKWNGMPKYMNKIITTNCLSVTFSFISILWLNFTLRGTVWLQTLLVSCVMCEIAALVPAMLSTGWNTDSTDLPDNGQTRIISTNEQAWSSCFIKYDQRVMVT
jgi:hypothetical protein